MVQHIIRQNDRPRYSPSKAINMDVFPDPVGPTMRLIWPRWKNKSPSIRSTKLRFEDPGVDEMFSSLAQVKVALRKPMTSLGISALVDINWTAMESGFSVN